MVTKLLPDPEAMNFESEVTAKALIGEKGLSLTRVILEPVSGFQATIPPHFEPEKTFPLLAKATHVTLYL